MLKKIIPIIIILFYLTACATSKNNVKSVPNSDKDSTKKVTFNKALKSNDYDLKYEKAMELYKRKKYTNALDLFEQLVPYEKGKLKGAEVYYMYCMCNFQIEDFIYAGYHFKSFYEMYSQSTYAQQALFMSAYCYYKDKPRWSLDQNSTDEGINQFQYFISKFPQSELIDSCNKLMDLMRGNLEKKSYQAGKLYFDMEYFKAADITMSNTIKDYPTSIYTEDVFYYIAKSNLLYANGSIKNKQQERYKKALLSANRYKKLYSQGKYIKEIEKIILTSNKQI